MHRGPLGWGPATDVPDNDDIVEFWGMYNRDCVMPNDVVVNAVRVYAATGNTGPDYTATITINKSLNVNGPAESFIGSPAHLFGGGGSDSKLRVGRDSQLSWRAGTLTNLGVEVDGFLTVAAAVGATPVMDVTGITVNAFGTLTWTRGNVTTHKSAAPGTYVPKIQVNTGGAFNIAAAGFRWGGAGSDELFVEAISGTITRMAEPAGTATLAGKLTNYGTVVVNTAALEITGVATQLSGTTELKSGGRLIVPNAAYDVRAGSIIGTGTVQGNLTLGTPPTDISPPNPPPEAIISPGPEGDQAQAGTITITENLHIFSGKMTIGVNGVADDQHDRVIVSGYAALKGVIEEVLTDAGRRIGGGQKVVFLRADRFIEDFTGEVLPPNWTKAHAKVGNNPAEYWFQAPPGQVMGRVGRDENGNGAFEPLDGDTGLADIPVYLTGPEGLTDQVVTDADGFYNFGAVPFGTYEVTVGLPSGLRPSPQHASAATPDTDSDIDTYTLLAAVTLDATSPFSTPRTDALFRPNGLPVAADDAFTAPYQTAVSGNVLANDTDPDGDTLTAGLLTPPTNGFVMFGADGSFTYCPSPGFSGSDSFTYAVDDGHGGTDTASVSITVGEPGGGDGTGGGGSGTGGTVRGRVWWDEDDDGIQDATETNTSGGWVALFDVNGNMVASATVNADGTYEFAGVAPGEYRLYASQASFVTAPPDQGGDDDLDSDVGADGFSALFLLAAGGEVDLDVGMVYAL